MNSTLSLELGKRYRSSTHGLPRTKNVRTRRKGLNHGLMGFFFRYSRSVPSISSAPRCGSCENLTKAPPSLRRGRISVTVSGSFLGMARRMRLIGSVGERSGFCMRFMSSGTDLSALKKGIRRSHWTFSGKTSGQGAVSILVVPRWSTAHTVEKEYALVGPCIDVT